MHHAPCSDTVTQTLYDIIKPNTTTLTSVSWTPLWIPLKIARDNLCKGDICVIIFSFIAQLFLVLGWLPVETALFACCKCHYRYKTRNRARRERRGTFLTYHIKHSLCCIQHFISLIIIVRTWTSYENSTYTVSLVCIHARQCKEVARRHFFDNYANRPWLCKHGEVGFSTVKVKAPTCLKHAVSSCPLPQPRPAGHFSFYVWLRARAAFYGHLDTCESETVHAYKENQCVTPLNWFIPPSGRPLLSLLLWLCYCFLSLPVWAKKTKQKNPSLAGRCTGQY